jgi:hypothetical protein
MSVERKEIGLRPVTLPDLETTRLNLSRMSLTKLGRQAMIALDQRDATRRCFKDVRGESPHARANLDKMIPGLRIETSNNGLRQVRIEEEILPEHLARPHTDLIETGAEFCFGHRKVIEPCGDLRQPG